MQVDGCTICGICLGDITHLGLVLIAERSHRFHRSCAGAWAATSLDDSQANGVEAPIQRPCVGAVLSVPSVSTATGGARSHARPRCVRASTSRARGRSARDSSGSSVTMHCLQRAGICLGVVVNAGFTTGRRSRGADV
eukprot:7327859-Pyramimonas_sp.AAC.1